MRVITERISSAPGTAPAAVAMGRFDGLHMGHKAVIGQAAAYAKQHGLALSVFTFAGGTKEGKRLQTEPQKHALLAEMGVENCYEPDFESFRELSPQQFFTQMLLGEYNAKALFCGENFGFGAKRAGDTRVLKQLCEEHATQLFVVPMACHGDAPVSSSRIRAALAEGEIEEANAMLGRPYEVELPVRHGKQLGGRLGFPTINQSIPQELQAPAFGVYITKTFLNGEFWPSATGYGTRPTVDNGTPSCETFIPGYSGNLYGRAVRVQFYKQIDKPHRFDTLEQLAAAVKSWAAQATGYFG